MGCCYSCKEDDSSQNGDANERTHLLVDPVSNNPSIQRVTTDDFLTQYPNSLPKKTDEQSAYNRILQETATNVIDVAALGAHNLEHHECMERMKIYASKLQMVPALTGHWVQPRRPPCILVDIPVPDKILSNDPIDVNDYFLAANAIVILYWLQQPNHKHCSITLVGSADSCHYMCGATKLEITSMVEKASAALTAFKVEHREDLVVPFRIP